METDQEQRPDPWRRELDGSSLGGVGIFVILRSSSKPLLGTWRFLQLDGAAALEAPLLRAENIAEQNHVA